MGRLTEILIEDCKDSLEKMFSDLEKAVVIQDQLMEPMIACCLVYELERLFYYNENEAVNYAVRFNSFQVGRKDLQPHEIRELIYTPEKDVKNSVKILGSLLSDLSVAVNDKPSEFTKKELYLYVVQRIAPLNPAVSQGYVEHFNELQKQRAAKSKSKKFYQILDRGKGNYVLAYEKQ